MYNKMLKWFTKKKEEPKPPKPKSARSTAASPPDENNLKLKKRMSLPRNFAKRVIDLEL